MSSSSSIPLDSHFPLEGLPSAPAGVAGEQLLAGAFASFREAAASLEHSYAQLHREVIRLRSELEESNQELKSSLQENRAVREFLHRILEVLPCGVLVTNASGEITLANPEARRLLGGPLAGRMEGNKIPSWMQAIQPDIHEDGAKEKSAKKNEDTATLEHECSPDGVVWIAVRRVQLDTSEGANTVLTLREVTQTRQVEALREELRRREALTEMSALLAHEIRNPLASLELFAGLLAESPLADDCSCWVRHVQAGLRTLAATVNNVLQFRGHPQPELVPTDLGELLANFENFLRPVAQQAEVEILLAHDLHDVFVLADRHRLQQVLFNLAWNAFRFMPDGGTLTISGVVQEKNAQNRKASPVARISIHDTGCGIPPEDIAKIFQPGFTTRPGSPGLGLAVCQELISQHGGNISVESVPGQGTTFHLELRIAEKAEGAERAQVLHFPDPNYRGKSELREPMRAGREA